jgi:serine/threonine-protein kinase HipA
MQALQHNPPAIDFMGKRTWAPGKNLQKFIAATFGIQPKEQQHMVQAISDAVADVAPQVRQAMAQHPGFEDIGKRMLHGLGRGRAGPAGCAGVCGGGVAGGGGV